MSVKMNVSETLMVGLAQIAPVWLDRERTLEKMLAWSEQAANQGCELAVFGEALVPGYTAWIELTDGARFNSQVQKEMFAHYAREAVQIEAGHLEGLCRLAGQRKMAIAAGIIERPPERSGHSLYCTQVFINAEGQIANVHRKLMPTYEERLVWAPGDGHGLRVQKMGAFTIGGLNCWENWMPLPRAALYGQGEDVHIAIWPGSKGLTEDITRFMAMEGRSYVLSVSGLLRKADIPEGTPHGEAIRAAAPEVLMDGGSCLAGPDGEWVIAPCTNEEKLLMATLDHRRVREERQNFDAAGHYSRPDVTELRVNRKRQSMVVIED